MKSNQQYIRFIIIISAIILGTTVLGDTGTELIAGAWQHAGAFLSYCEETLISQGLAQLQLS